MDDRTLLALAAKACGLSQADHPFFFGGLTEKVPSAEGYGVRSWNPLTSDGDALRLAVKLCIDLDIYGCYVEALWVDMDRSETHCVNEDWGTGEEDDTAKMKHVRRAIVRAAAAIGADHIVGVNKMVSEARNHANNPLLNDYVEKTVAAEREKWRAALSRALEALWTLVEHNKLHFGESHNTVIQGSAAIKELEELGIA